VCGIFFRGLPFFKNHVILQFNDNSMKDFKKSTGFGGRPSFGAKRSSEFGSDRTHEKHKATCNSCHRVCEVPFRPNGKKPVYCRDCYKTATPTPSFSREKDSYSREVDSRKEEFGLGDMKKQFSILNAKLDRLTAVIEDQTTILSSIEK